MLNLFRRPDLYEEKLLNVDSHLSRIDITGIDKLLQSWGFICIDMCGTCYRKSNYNIHQFELYH